MVRGEIEGEVSVKETRRAKTSPIKGRWLPSKHITDHLQEITTKSNWVSGQTCCCCCCICCICICCCWILWLATAFFKFSMNCFWSLGINPMYCKPAGAFFIRRRIIIWGGFSAEFSFLKCCKKCDTHIRLSNQSDLTINLRIPTTTPVTWFCWNAVVSFWRVWPCSNWNKTVIAVLKKCCPICLIIDVCTSCIIRFSGQLLVLTIGIGA